MMFLKGAVLIGTLVAALAFSPGATAIGDEIETAIQSVRALQDTAVKEHSHWNISGTEKNLTNNPGEVTELVTPVKSWSDGLYRMVESIHEVQGRRKTIIGLSNPDYSATIARFDSQPWSIESLYFKDESTYRSNHGPSFTPLRDYSAPPFSLLLDEIGDGTFSKSRSDEQSTTFHVVMPEPEPSAATSRPKFRDVFVVIAKADGQPVVSRLAAVSQTDAGPVRIIMKLDLELADWRQTSEGLIPATIISRGQRLDPADDSKVLGEGTIEKKYDYSQFDSEFDTEQCWLSHYGLPEPGESTGISRWWLLVGVLAIVAGVIAVRMIRTP
jgi:hypothetical protein